MKVSGETANLVTVTQQPEPEQELDVQFENLTPETSPEQIPEESCDHISPGLSEELQLDLDLDVLIDLPPEFLPEYTLENSNSNMELVLEEPHETFDKKVLESFYKNFIQVKKINYLR